MNRRTFLKSGALGLLAPLGLASVKAEQSRHTVAAGRNRTSSSRTKRRGPFVRLINVAAPGRTPHLELQWAEYRDGPWCTRAEWDGDDSSKRGGWAEVMEVGDVLDFS